MTLIAGVITTALSCFPVVFLRLLDYVAVYGLILMPIGAIVLAEHWILPRLGIAQYRAETCGWLFNWNAVVVWIGTLAACYFLPVHLFFKWLPGYAIALVAYVVLQKVFKPKPTGDHG